MESRSARSLLQGSRQIFHKHYNWTGCSAPIIAPSFWGNHGCHSLLCSNVRKNFRCMKVLRFCIRLFTTEAISQISHIYDKFLSYDSSDHIFMHGSFRCHMHGFTSFRTWVSIMNTLPHEKKILYAKFTHKNGPTNFRLSSMPGPHLSPQPKRHLRLFSRFVWLWSTDIQTHRHR